jgi:hypothetical protein
MKRDLLSGILLITGALTGMAVMVLHPTGRTMITHENFQSQGLLNMAVHGVALAAVPVLFLGLLGLSRRLGSTELTTAALVAYGFGAVAVMCAAVASGFIATPVIEQILTGPAESRAVYHVLLSYTGLVNQGFAKVNVAASSVAVLLWSAAIWQGGRMPRAPGVVGGVIGAGVLLVLLSGYLRLDVHGFGIVTFAQSLWLIWLGVLLCREGGVRYPEPAG